METMAMKALAVFPGQPNSLHLAELPKPSLDEIPDGRGVLVRVLRVGVDGTDKEINAAEYGMAPPGDDYLILGHESFGVVEAVADGVTELAPGDYVVASVRRPGSSIYDAIGLQDMTTDDVYFERGINLELVIAGGPVPRRDKTPAGLLPFRRDFPHEVVPLRVAHDEHALQHGPVERLIQLDHKRVL